MEWLLNDGVICSRLLPPEVAEGILRTSLLRARLADSIAETYRLDERNGFEDWQATAIQYRDLPWTTLPGDKFWITVDPRPHPEVKIGVASLVVVRNGKVVFRERLGVI
jgi:hypothetical protein